MVFYVPLILPFPCFSADATSLASRYLTKEIYDKLIHLQTRYGFTLSDALQSGIENPDSSIGIYAGDSESYDLFDAIFRPVIAKYHNIDGTLPCPMKSDFTSITLPDPDPEHQYIISTRIRVARNLANFPFTPILSLTDRKQVENVIIDSLDDIESPFKGHYTPIKETSVSNDQIERHICTAPNVSFKRGDRFQEAAGINRDWPDGRGVFESNDQKFMVWINEEDHMRIISIDQNSDIRDLFNRLGRGLHMIQTNLACKQMYFAWRDDLGYLTTCPSNLGTGMRAGVHIKLPKLFKHKEILESAARGLKLQVRGTQGEKTEVESAIFDISNSQRLGITERQCCQILYNGICKIIDLEKEL